MLKFQLHQPWVILDFFGKILKHYQGGTRIILIKSRYTRIDQGMNIKHHRFIKMITDFNK